MEAGRQGGKRGTNANDGTKGAPDCATNVDLCRIFHYYYDDDDDDDKCYICKYV